MKKLVMFVFFVLIFVNGVLGISTDLKENYELGETMIVQINGNILEPIGKEQIEFRRGHVGVPFEYDLKKLGDKYFLWAVAREDNNNYTLVIKDITASVLGKTEKINFEQNFSISGNLTDYYIKPGFFYYSSDFSADIQLNEDFDKTISIDFPSERGVVLRPGKNKVYFSVADVNTGELLMANIGKYVIPTYVVKKEENASVIEEVSLRLNPLVVNGVALIGGAIEYPFEVINFGKRKVSNVKLRYNESLFRINVENSFDIESLNSNIFNISFIGVVNEGIIETGIRESVYVEVGSLSLELPVIIGFTKNESEVEIPSLEENKSLSYCEYYDGVGCSEDQTCDGSIVATINEVACCYGGKGCVDKADGGSNAWIGWIIAGVVLVGIIFVFWKYKKEKKGKDGFNKRVNIAEKKLSNKP